MTHITHPHPQQVVTPEWWCTNCGIHRAAEADGVYGSLCPGCSDVAKAMRAEQPSRATIGGVAISGDGAEQAEHLTTIGGGGGGGPLADYSIGAGGNLSRVAPDLPRVVHVHVGDARGGYTIGSGGSGACRCRTAAEHEAHTGRGGGTDCGCRTVADHEAHTGSAPTDDRSCCELNEDGYVLAHQHADGTLVGCAPTRCPGCTMCPREGES